MAKILTPEEIKAIREKRNANPLVRPVTAGTTPVAEGPTGTPSQAAATSAPAAAQTTQATTPQAATPAPAVTSQPAAQAAQAPATTLQAATPAPEVTPQPPTPSPAAMPAPSVAKPAELTVAEILAKNTKASEGQPSPYTAILQPFRSFWNWVKSEKKKLIAVGISCLALYSGMNIATYFYDVHTKKKAEDARLLDEKKDNEARKERNARKAEELKIALKAKEDAKEEKIKSKTAEIVKRCNAAASQPDKKPLNQLNTVLAHPVCMSNEDIAKWKSIAEMYEQAGEFRKAGQAYLEYGNLNKAKQMLSSCKNQKTKCEHELLSEESVVITEAIERQARMPKKE